MPGGGREERSDARPRTVGRAGARPRREDSIGSMSAPGQARQRLELVADGRGAAAQGGAGREPRTGDSALPQED